MIAGAERSPSRVTCGDVSRSAQMSFGRLMNILNLLQVVKRIELEIEKIMWQEKTAPHFSLSHP